MSKVKIYDGITFDLGTGKVMSTGEVSYVDSNAISYLGGGGTATSTTGFSGDINDPTSTAYRTNALLSQAQGLYDSGQMGQVIGFNDTQRAAQQTGLAAAGRQTQLEQAMADQANKGVDLSGMRTSASNQAMQALGMSNSNAAGSGNLGSSRQSLNQSSISNDLAAKFAQVDQAEQATNFANKQSALGLQGTGAGAAAGIGAGQQQMQQNQADAPFKALSQIGSMYHGLGNKTTTTEQGK